MGNACACAEDPKGSTSSPSFRKEEVGAGGDFEYVNGKDAVTHSKDTCENGGKLVENGGKPVENGGKTVVLSDDDEVVENAKMNGQVRNGGLLLESQNALSRDREVAEEEVMVAEEKVKVKACDEKRTKESDSIINSDESVAAAAAGTQDPSAEAKLRRRKSSGKEEDEGRGQDEEPDVAPVAPPRRQSKGGVAPTVSEKTSKGIDVLELQKALEGEDEDLVNMMAGELAALVARLETAVEKLEKSAGGSGAASDSAAPAKEVCTVPFVLAYDDFLSGPFKSFLDCSEKIGGDVASIAKIVQATFTTQRAFLVMVSKSKKPSEADLPKVLEPMGKKIQEVIDFRESHRSSPRFNHLSAISESIPGLSWVAVAPAPAPFVKEMGDAAVFYTNRVLKDYRDKDKKHVEWVQHWNTVFKDLQEYVRKFHTTGAAWNAGGGDALTNLKAAPPAGSVPPPPPPGGIPPPPPMINLEPKKVETEDDGRAALFADLNKGLDITCSLKKVSDDMKTHKNPSLREGPKPFTKSSSPPVNKTSGPSNSIASRPPKFALEGRKWFVEYQKNQPELTISKTSMDQSVYMFRCENTVVQVKGKINSLVMDSCKKSSVVFDTLVSGLEIVNCQSSKAQVMDKLPTVTIEKTDGCQVFLSKASLATEIVTAKSSEMNIMIPTASGEFNELPVPEQFKTVIKNNKLVTECTEKAS
ncbi:adenylyl cyclase-associated protein 1 isoform X2 [Oratosquilla oratoria]|uniref:adenylyl cyclase-associated protein 1 isoform X2 n=1 Tax=Oratosquilla oratoria TaxID=337810 RepID=UPI003F75B947